MLVTQEMISKVLDEIKNCFEALQDIRGAHIDYSYIQFNKSISNLSI